MLARLDRDLAPLCASVDRAGTLLRVEGSGISADVASRVRAIVAAMGYVAEQLDAPAPPVAWFSSADVDELSREEAVVLAERWTAEMASEGVIDQAGRLLDPLNTWLLRSFRAAARTGTVEMGLIEARELMAVVNEREAGAVRAWLEQRLGVHGRLGSGTPPRRSG